MILPALTSVTFRKLAPEEVVALAAGSGLKGIEWGGDIHVPPGRPEMARRVRALTRSAGLEVSSYGSYYRAGHPETGPFEAVLETALELEAPAIRIWAGRRASAEADPAYRAAVTADVVRVCRLAAAAGRTVAFEYHANTLTDESLSARRLLLEADQSNLRTYWQPPNGLGLGESLQSLKAILPWLSNLHVFYWNPDGKSRRPLAEGTGLWRRYLSVAYAVPGRHYAILEFVMDDAPENFRLDALTLLGWLEELRPPEYQI
ncbi:MAG TPA: TIM barrel protein [bacterium]|uniref:3-dehydroshikimate dehydratase n=1 Tax=candidate division TA06 bacterium ADurb.Bin417 TaxID=1852828 RepID=A0A1V5M9F0_UNCT6|nr:MAG: 3-dehydroshikimate dehydratase [candidate division TA06 bacterium ADurb.Bin417]HNQ34984.1 TIM barrel protein [bacterium]HNS49339.1 TIM barrel protein [bacterium]